MVGYIDWRCLVCRRFEFDFNLVAWSERVGDSQRQCPWVSLVGVGARVCKHDANPFLFLKGFRLPHCLIEPFDPAVKVVRSIVDGQRVSLTIESESSFADSVAIPANDRSQE